MISMLFYVVVHAPQTIERLHAETERVVSSTETVGAKVKELKKVLDSHEMQLESLKSE
jgi:hypothetical protein